jgi:hypothetical protein
MTLRFASRPLTLALAFLCMTSVYIPQGAAQSEPSNRRAYEAVVDMKQKTIGTVILMDMAGNNVTGWMRLGKFLPIESGTVTDTSAGFRAGGNSYKIDEKKGRIAYSGPDGNGDSIASRLTPITGLLSEVTEGERFTGTNIATLDVNGRTRRFNIEEPSLWKRHGPPFEKFNRIEELLQRNVTFWVADADQKGTVEIVEEPEGMDIPLKAPKKPKEKKK